MRNERNRHTDDGTYINAGEEREKVNARISASAAPPEAVTITDTSTTWTHGTLKVVMRTFTNNGVMVRTVKAIDIRAVQRGHGHNSFQWEGTLEEFAGFVGSLHLLGLKVEEKLKDEVASVSEQKFGLASILDGSR